MVTPKATSAYLYILKQNLMVCLNNLVKFFLKIVLRAYLNTDN